jgi:hypothetical protein
MGKGLRHLLKEDTQTTNRYRKKCSTSFTIREIKVKSKMRYHLIPAMLLLKRWSDLGMQRSGTVLT